MPTTADGYSYEPVPQVGSQPPYPPELVARSRALLAGTLALMGNAPLVLQGARLVSAKYPVHGRRATDAAAVVGVDPAELLAANLCYDTLLGLSAMGCSTMALAGPDGPTLARNMDWFPEAKVARASCLVSEEYGTNAGFLGMIGAVTGLSRNGFAVCLNAAFGGSDLAGYPVLLFLRHVLDTATGYRQALEMVTAERLMTAGIVTLVGTRNDERAVVERLPRRAAVRTPTGNGPLLATNHFRDLADPAECPRYDHMAIHAGKGPPLEVLTSRHVLQDITAQHVVMCPATESAEMYAPTHLLRDDYREAHGLADLMGFFTS
jgi:isopenicillin-N N-acyltransferase like protein